MARQENVYWVPATSFLCLSARLTVIGGTGVGIGMALIIGLSHLQFRRILVETCSGGERGEFEVQVMEMLFSDLI